MNEIVELEHRVNSILKIIGVANPPHSSKTIEDLIKIMILNPTLTVTPTANPVNKMEYLIEMIRAVNAIFNKSL